MGDSENYKDETEGLIDVSEFESDFDEDALTEIEHQEDEEVTPIKRRPKKSKEKRKADKAKIRLPEGQIFVATLRERFAAFFIDSLVLFYFYWIYALFYCRLFLGSWNATIPFSGWHGLAFNGSFLLISFLYYFMFEGIFLTTIGKFVCWMSVRKKNFEPASLFSTFIRNFFRLLDYVLIFPVVFIMELTKYRQRIGDIFARTTVVKKYGTAPESYDIPDEMYASASGRTVGIIIDMTLFGLFIFGYVLMWSPKRPFISEWLLLLTPLAILTYFVLIEMITETSPGKWLMGYITCHDNGRRLTISGSIVRNVWRLFDTNPIGLICVFLSSKRRRPGDLAGGTVVIKHRRTVKGAISFGIAIVLAACTLYIGMNTKSNILSKKFKFNFAPNLSFLENLGLESSKFENLTIDNFRFAANEPNNLRVPPSFNGGETVFIIFELFGYEKRDRKVWLQEDIAVRYPDGVIGLRQNNIVDYRQVVKGRGPIELTNNIALPKNAKPGKYEIYITIRDKFARSDVKETSQFYVRRPLVPDDILEESKEEVRNETIKAPEIGQEAD